MCLPGLRHTDQLVGSVGRGGRLAVLLRGAEALLEQLQAPKGHADAEAVGPGAGPDLYARDEVADVPERLDDDADAVREVALLDGAAVEHCGGVLREQVGVVGGHVGRRRRRVQDAGDDAGGVDEAAEDLVRGVREQLAARLLLEHRADEAARRVEGPEIVDALDMGRHFRIGGEVKRLYLEEGRESQDVGKLCFVASVVGMLLERIDESLTSVGLDHRRLQRLKLLFPSRDFGARGLPMNGRMNRHG